MSQVSQAPGPRGALAAPVAAWYVSERSGGVRSYADPNKASPSMGAAKCTNVAGFVSLREVRRILLGVAPLQEKVERVVGGTLLAQAEAGGRLVAHAQGELLRDPSLLFILSNPCVPPLVGVSRVGRQTFLGDRLGLTRVAARGPRWGSDRAEVHKGGLRRGGQSWVPRGSPTCRRK